MLYKIISSIVTFGMLKTSLSLKRSILQSLTFFVATFFLVYSNNYFFIPFLAIALAEGLGIGFFESVVAKATKNSPSVSFDIGLLHAPMRFAEFASLLFAGFIAQSIGYMPIFVLSGFFYSIFSILAWYVLKVRDN